MSPLLCSIVKVLLRVFLRFALEVLDRKTSSLNQSLAKFLESSCYETSEDCTQKIQEAVYPDSEQNSQTKQSEH